MEMRTSNRDSALKVIGSMTGSLPLNPQTIQTTELQELHQVWDDAMRRGGAGPDPPPGGNAETHDATPNAQADRTAGQADHQSLNPSQNENVGDETHESQTWFQPGPRASSQQPQQQPTNTQRVEIIGRGRNTV